jgi:hypothetical protein
VNVVILPGLMCLYNCSCLSKILEVIDVRNFDIFYVSLTIFMGKFY